MSNAIKQVRFRLRSKYSAFVNGTTNGGITNNQVSVSRKMSICFFSEHDIAESCETVGEDPEKKNKRRSEMDLLMLKLLLYSFTLSQISHPPVVPGSFISN